MRELHCPRVRFLSPGDESAFFRWAEDIPGIASVTGEGENIVLMARARLSEQALRELIALFHRYNAPLAQLAVFATPANSSWFISPDAYWHKLVFPNGA